jgi:hypothetical protein
MNFLSSAEVGRKLRITGHLSTLPLLHIRIANTATNRNRRLFPRRYITAVEKHLGQVWKSSTYRESSRYLDSIHDFNCSIEGRGLCDRLPIEFASELARHDEYDTPKVAALLNVSRRAVSTLVRAGVLAMKQGHEGLYISQDNLREACVWMNPHANT